MAKLQIEDPGGAGETCTTQIHIHLIQPIVNELRCQENQALKEKRLSHCKNIWEVPIHGAIQATKERSL